MSNSFTPKKQNILGNKSAICAITLILVLALSAFAVILPKASAQTATHLTIPQWAYLNAFPSPIGVGQTISLFAWTATYPPTANGAYGDRWTNMTIIVTLPDGTKTTLGPYVSDPVGTTFQSYIPTQTGNYTFQFVDPQQTITGQPFDPAELAQAQAFATANKLPLSVGESIFITGWSSIGNVYTAATSTPVTVNVQSTAIPSAPNYPLPTEYWSVPVSQPGHEFWSSITGDWLANGELGSNVNDYAQPPTTAHIAWTRPINFGGIGGQPQAINSGGDNYYSYLSYESMFNPPIIMNGQLYYNTPNPPEYGFVDIDLATGQQVWYQNGTNAWSNIPGNPVQIGFGFAKQNYPQLSFGQELDYESPNQHGLIDYLWATWTAPNGSSVWSMFDPFTGNWICNLWNIPSGGAIFGASSMITDATGTLLSYSANFVPSASAPKGTFIVWNSTAVIQNTNPSMAQTNGYWMWRPPLGGQIDASQGGTSVYNITGSLPAITITNGPFGPSASATLVGLDKTAQIAIYSSAPSTLGMATYPSPATFTQFAISIAPSTIGQVVWSQTFPWPSGNVTLESGFIGDGVFTLFEKETAVYMGFSEHTGAQLYTTSPPEVANHIYGVSGGIYNGVMYSGDSIGEGGTIYAYNATTGTLLWSNTTPSMGFTGYWDNIPSSVGSFSSGNLYWYGEEHSPGPNLEPGFMIGDVNTTTGAPIWNITFWSAGGGIGGGMCIADGYMPLLNAYDNQIYCFGKGPTETTVGSVWSNLGQNLVIQGSVIDKSAGSTQTSIAARFPQGVPAVSDDSQTAFMEYVYMQNPIPGNTTGVPVGITLIDPNGNTINEQTTSDMSGHYSYDYKIPNVPGTYTVIATFHGSNSYWPSYSESTFQVDQAASPTTAPTATPTSAADMYFVPAIAGLFVLIIVGLIVLALLVLRKRP